MSLLLLLRTDDHLLDAPFLWALHRDIFLLFLIVHRAGNFPLFCVDRRVGDHRRRVCQGGPSFLPMRLDNGN